MKDATDAAHRTRDPIVNLGGAFMTSEEMAAEEVALGLPERSLYFRGRSAVLGDPSAPVVTALFGIFPDWLIELMISKSVPAVSAAEAIDAYTRACASWGRRVFADDSTTSRAATLLGRMVDAADLSALPLAAGWQVQPRPGDAPAHLAFTLMLARELRGGLHFAALRTCGLGIREAIVADPGGGRGRLLRTAWSPDEADVLIARAHRRSDLIERWQRAELLTDESFGLALRLLTDAERDELTELLTSLPTTS